MATPSAAEVRIAGNWTALEVPAADAAQFIALGNAWLVEKLGMSLADYTTADTEKGEIAKQASIYFIAWLIASRPAKEGYTIGTVKNDRVKGDETVKLADHLESVCKKLLSSIGLTMDKKYEFDMTGGDDYHPLNEDDTQIDFGVAQADDEYPFNPLGVEYP